MFRTIFLIIFIPTYLFLNNHTSNTYELGSFLIFLYSLAGMIDGFNSKEFIFSKFMAFLATVQWLVAPIILSFYDLKFRTLYVPLNDYLAYALPGTIFFILGLKVFKNDFSFIELIERAKNDSNKNKKMGVILFIIGSFFTILSKQNLNELLNFWVGTLSLLTYVGFLYTFFNGNILYKQISFIMLGIIIMQTLDTTLFYYLLFTLIVLFSFFTSINNVSKSKITLIIFLGIIGVIILQSIKMEARSKIWSNGTNKSSAEVFVAVYKIRSSQEDKINQSIMLICDRLNMGLYSSRVMALIPSKNDFVSGETYFNATIGSIIPRILWPNKPKSGGKEIMMKLAEYDVGNASLNVSHLGESYGNFGKIGGIICLFIIGLIISYTLNYFIKVAIIRPTLLFWIPIYFTDILRCEIDFGQMFNGIIKQGIFIFIIFWLSDNIFKSKL